MGGPLHRLAAAEDEATEVLIPPAPQKPSELGTLQAQQAYRAALQAYGNAVDALREQQRLLRPWYVRNVDFIIGYAIFAAGTWYLWGLFRAVGAGRKTALDRHPPTCEFCGYNLTAAEMDGRCPECGQAVRDSLGPQARPGALWERRAETGRMRAWWRCMVDPIRRPLWFGRQLRVRGDRSDHRRFAVMHVVPMFFVAMALLWLAYYLDQGHSPFKQDPDVAWLGGPCVGYCAAAAVVLLPTTAAGALGIWYRVRGDRNLMAGLMQAGCYLTGYVTATVVLLMLAFIVFLVTDVEQATRRLEQAAGVPGDVMLVAVLLCVPAVLLGGYVWLLARMARGFRYANR